ncbi:MAG: hypothetical protein V3S56_00750 [Gemmatimonadota bacterium]
MEERDALPICTDADSRFNYFQTFRFGALQRGLEFGGREADMVHTGSTTGYMSGDR